jgi:hypothetical protein
MADMLAGEVAHNDGEWVGRQAQTIKNINNTGLIKTRVDASSHLAANSPSWGRGILKFHTSGHTDHGP